MTPLEEELRRLNSSLETLNTNLEAFAVLVEGHREIPELLRDLRTMAAPLLGWRVKTVSEDVQE